MSRRNDEYTTSNPTMPDLAQFGAQQVEAILQAQASIAQRVQEANATSLIGLEEVGRMAQALQAKLAVARSTADIAGAWQEWIGNYLQFAEAHANRLMSDAQAIFSAGTTAFSTAASERRV